MAVGGLLGIITKPIGVVIGGLWGFAANVARITIAMIAASGPIGWVIAAVYSFGAAFLWFRESIFNWFFRLVVWQQKEERLIRKDNYCAADHYAEDNAENVTLERKRCEIVPASHGKARKVAAHIAKNLSAAIGDAAKQGFADPKRKGPKFKTEQVLGSELQKQIDEKFKGLSSMPYADIDKHLAEIAASTGLSADHLKDVGISVKDSYFEQVKQNRLTMDGFGKLDGAGKLQALQDKKNHIEQIAKDEQAFSLERAMMESGNKGMAEAVTKALPKDVQKGMLDYMTMFSATKGRDMTPEEIMSEMSSLSEENRKGLQSALAPWKAHQVRMSAIDKQKSSDLETIGKRIAGISAGSATGAKAMATGTGFVSPRQAQYWAASIDKTMGISGGQPKDVALANEWAKRKSRGQFNTYADLVAAANTSASAPVANPVVPGSVAPANTSASAPVAKPVVPGSVAPARVVQAQTRPQSRTRTAQTQNAALTNVGAGGATSDQSTATVAAQPNTPYSSKDATLGFLGKLLESSDEQNVLLKELIKYVSDKTGGTTLGPSKPGFPRPLRASAGNASSDSFVTRPWAVSETGAGENR
jgi:hypothetical protein